MTGKQADRLLAGRVEALAMMHLTRRDDLDVRREIRAPGDPVTDLSVEVREAGQPSPWKRFGVYLRGARSPVTLPAADLKVKGSLRQFFEHHGEPSFPYCLFFFTMEDSRGYYTWLAEPVAEGRSSRLRYHRHAAACSPLDLASLDSIVASVDSYYSALRSLANLAL